MAGMLRLTLAGAAWSCAFSLFTVFYGLVLVRPRVITLNA
jgi:uncharacterized protein involved in response to NO